MPAVRRATIGDVASSCGLSKTTVSKVMNVPPEELDVPAATRQRVLEAAERLGYRPSWRARAFASRRTHTIGLIHRDPIPMFRGDFWYDIVFGLTAGFDHAGYDAQLVSASAQRTRWRDMLMDERLDGCVVMHELTAHVAEALVQARLPVVLLNAEGTGAWTRVVPDDHDGARQLARHLVTLGHRRIAFVHNSAVLAHFSFGQRLAGIRQAMDEAGVGRPILEVKGEPDEAVQQIVAMPADERPTALVAYHDLVALPLLHACWRAGLRVPQDVSIGTFNDVPATRLSIPPLTTVSVPAADMAGRAVELLLSRLRDPRRAPRPAAERVVLPERLVVRESTAAPAG
jgi:DNA-binding LacI/PurR family transcriptional regulator